MKKRSYIFEHAMKVRDYECDAQGYVNNANYQHYFEVARHEFMAKHGLNFYDLTKKESMPWFLMLKSAINRRCSGWRNLPVPSI